MECTGLLPRVHWVQKGVQESCTEKGHETPRNFSRKVSSMKGEKSSKLSKVESILTPWQYALPELLLHSKLLQLITARTPAMSKTKGAHRDTTCEPDVEPLPVVAAADGAAVDVDVPPEVEAPEGEGGGADPQTGAGSKWSCESVVKLKASPLLMHAPSFGWKKVVADAFFEHFIVVVATLQFLPAVAMTVQV